MKWAEIVYSSLKTQYYSYDLEKTYAKPDCLK